jgi:hypothetical protein
MTILSRVSRFARLVGLSVSLAAFNPPRRVVASPSVVKTVADSVAGEWKAQGSDPGWNGRFTLHLLLTQIGDSVSGTYQFELDRATVVPPADVFGHIRGGKLELGDRADRLWLLVTPRGDHLDGRLAGGSRQRASAIPISFTRVERRS